MIQTGKYYYRKGGVVNMKPNRVVVEICPTNKARSCWPTKKWEKFKLH